MTREILALDIGTRKVMGLVCVRGEDGLEVLDMEVIEHSTRCMLDGQVHSIEEVARAVTRIREQLESRLGRRFESAGVAAAGRNLTTYKSLVERELAVSGEVTPALLKDMELEAVDRISSDSGNGLADFYCVGYSPLFYEIDGNRINDPVGHTARLVRTGLIATFLPRIVLDSIRAVLARAGLPANNITLEPIAAINAIIPPELRKLNIILVDIGAGTSDLALARDGQVFAYGMVPEAGDEVTEHISESLLTDFGNAEKLKRSAGSGSEIAYVDIWDRAHSISAQALRELIAPSVRRLADSIAASAMELNGGAPQAVVLVGGGALTPGLLPEISRAFGLPEHKVGVRLPGLIKSVRDVTGRLNGPEAVTPIGIAMMAEQARGLRFIDVEVNGARVSLFDFEQKKDVLGVLTLAGALVENKLHARPGLALTCTLNGELRIIKGGLGRPAAITLNGRPVDSLAEKIDNGDSIVFEGAVDGEDASCRLRDIVETRPVQVFCNGQGLDVWPLITVNGVPAAPGSAVPDRAAVEIQAPTAARALELAEVKTEGLSQRQVLVNINGVPKILTQKNFSLSVNGAACDLDTALSVGDRLDFTAHTATFYRIRDIIDVPCGREKLRVSVNGSEVELTVEAVQVFMNGQPVNPEEFIIDGADIRVCRSEGRAVMLSEIFKYVDVDPQGVRGKRLRILVNDQPAGFTTPLAEGARVRIQFEER